jgi:hypothetical protein
MEKVGFIILRHVTNETTNKYWILCYDNIRKYYPENLIMIIDDNSSKEFLTEKELYKTTIINSEYHGRGELLPYYYYLHNKLFDTAVIFHDSVFIYQYIDFSEIENYKIIWNFEHHWDQIEDETKMIKLFNDDELLAFYEDKNLWKGCFGGMSIITHDYLTFINSKYEISKLLDHILTRYNRMSFERVIACLLQKNIKNKSLFGDIFEYCKDGTNFNDIDKYKNNLEIVKVWTGR